MSEISRLIKKSNTDILFGDEWPIDHPIDKSYEFTFREFLLMRSFDDILLERIKNNESTHVLDIMGSGYFLTNPDNTTSITGVRLTDIDESLKIFNSSFNSQPIHKYIESLQSHRDRKIITGNIIDPRTWRKLTERKEEIQSGFDLVVMRPVAGWENILPHSIDKELVTQDLNVNSIKGLEAGGALFITYLNRVIKMMNPNADFFLEMPSSKYITSKYYDLLIERIKVLEGVSIELGKNTVMIHKL